MKTSPPPKFALWNAPPGWRGEAAGADAARFPFADLPWLALKRAGERLGEFECVKASHSRRVLVFPAEAPLGEKAGALAGRRLYAKRYLINKLRRRIATALAGPKAEREFKLGREMLRAALPVPEPLAYAWHRREARLESGEALPAASYLLSLEWPNSGSAKDWIEAGRGGEPFAEGLARFLARAHGRGFYHDDCAADHLLVGPANEDAPDPAFAFIDVDNGRLYGSPVAWRLRALNVFQILRSIDARAWGAKGRARFVEEYLSSAGPAAPASAAFKDSVEAIAKRKIGKGVLAPKR